MRKRKKRRLRKSIKISFVLFLFLIVMVSVVNLFTKTDIKIEVNTEYASVGDNNSEILIERSDGILLTKELVNVQVNGEELDTENITCSPESVDVSKVGKTEISYYVSRKRMEKTIRRVVIVRDTIAPEIIPIEDVISTEVGTEPEYKKMFFVKDLSKQLGYSESDKNEPGIGWFRVTADTDFQTEGVYQLHVYANDGWGNETEQEYPITVVKPIEIERNESDHTGVLNNTDQNLLIVANKKNPLAQGYEPSDLRIVNCDTNYDGWYLRDEAASAIESMFDAAAAQGVTLICKSGYRSAEYQSSLYNNYVNMYGSYEADRISSRPGYSDHQTGLAMDIGDHDLATVFTTDMEYTIEGQWLYEHAHEFGFILRYPKGKEDITGYSFEPWHYRYVGITAATEMYNISPDYTLEEYTGLPGGDYTN